MEKHQRIINSVQRKINRLHGIEKKNLLLSTYHEIYKRKNDTHTHTHTQHYPLIETDIRTNEISQPSASS